MPRQHHDIIAERKELLFDSAKKQFTVAARQIPTAYSAGKQNVASDQQLIFSREKTETARTMPRHFQDFELESEEVAPRRRFDQEIGFNRLDLELEPKATEEFRVGDHGCGLGMTTDSAVEPPFDFRNVRDVIEVAMRQQEQLRSNAFALQPFARTIRRIEEDRAFGRFNEITIRLEYPPAKSPVFH